MATIGYSPVSVGTDGGAPILVADVNSAISISSVGLGATYLVTTATPHQLRPGDTTVIVGTNSTPAIDGTRTVAAVLSPTTFTSTGVTVTVAGTAAGTSTKSVYNSDIMDRGLLQGGGAVVITSAVGATPTVTVNIQGSIDGLNWFNVPYALVATPRTFVLTALTITTAVTTTYLLQELIPWRFARLAETANTNVTLTATAWSR